MFLHKNRDIYVVDIIRVLCIIQKHVNIYIVKYLNNKIRPYNTALRGNGAVVKLREPLVMDSRFNT